MTERFTATTIYYNETKVLVLKVSNRYVDKHLVQGYAARGTGQLVTQVQSPPLASYKIKHTKHVRDRDILVLYI